MKLSSPQKECYAKDRLTALQAQRLAQEIAFGPVVFQISRLMVKWGLFELLINHPKGLTETEIVQKTGLSPYAVRILFESSLTIGTVLTHDDKFFIGKAGVFLLNDESTRVNMDFNHDVNYLGLFNLEEALQQGKPAGLKVLGTWPTIYEGLSQLPPQVQRSWFGFDHFYSDRAWDQALGILFAGLSPCRRLLDVGGNTGRWACKCVAYNPSVEVTVMDLPQQLELMREAVKDVCGRERIHGHSADLLNPTTAFPTGFDTIWMSQFLDCFSEEEIVSILSRAARSMTPESRLFIMETFWDLQRHETASYCLTQISVYFTVMANGNSKMYHSDAMRSLVERAGLQVARLHPYVGMAHSLMECTIA